MHNLSVDSLPQSIIDQYFHDGVMSIHIKAGERIGSKQGQPGSRRMIYTDTILSHDETKSFIATILEEVEARTDGTIEISRQYSTVIQLGHYRIVIVYPPLSDDYEITIIRPIKRLTFSDYKLESLLVDRIDHGAQGILIAGSPGSGKTTFAQALVDHIVEGEHIVKTIEAPRDLDVDGQVVQYSFTHGTHDEVRDILLLSRPDYAIYDEIRNVSDFILYKDLRLTGIGLIGVIHATKAIDAVQRFIGTVSLGMIPQVIDTVIFMQAGVIHTVYALSFIVKTPTGMMSEDLARPVVEVKDLFSGQLMYELYSFGEQVVVMPLDGSVGGGEIKSSPLERLAGQSVQAYFGGLIHSRYYMQLKSTSLTLYVDEYEKGGLIGKEGSIIRQFEKDLGLSISIKTLDDLPESHTLDYIIPSQVRQKKKRFRY